MTSNKQSYVDAIAIGQMVAFKVESNGVTKAISGKIEIVSENKFTVVTKNGAKFDIVADDILWVKTTERWPKGIYLALQGKADVNEHRRED